MEYNHERYTLNHICEFRDSGAESDFMEFEKTASLNISRSLILIMGFAFAMFAFSDYYFHKEENSLIFCLGLRGAGLLIAIVTFSFVGRFKRYENVLVVITVAELTVFAIYLLKIYTFGSHEPALQFMTMMLFIMAVFLIPNKWKNCLVVGCVFLAAYTIFSLVFFDSKEPPSLPHRVIYLSICLAACAVFLFGRESSRRRQFATEKLLEFMSITDRLTGIFNRGRFEYMLGQWIKSLRHNPFCLLFFDIDDFKKVNDQFGHMTGDKVLVDIAEIVTAHIRADDIFARWGGEEFVVLFSRTGIEMAAELAERLRKTIEAYPSHEVGKITVSIGVVEFRNGETVLDLVKRADDKMYEAKKAGKNRVSAG